MTRNRRLFSLIAALLLIAAFGLTSCKSDVETEIPEETSDDRDFQNALDEDFSHRFPAYTELIADYYELNDETVGWLSVPGTHIDDIVVCHTDPDDLNRFYERRDFEKQYNWHGVFYADFRNLFGEGRLEELSDNTVIYGHTLDEDWDGPKFAPLFYFTEEEFARETPYIYFSTRGEDLVWEVFAVFYTTVDLPYNRPDLSTEEFAEVLSECVKRSIYTYDTQVSAGDKILTLSTCCYSLPGKGKIGYYPNEYRYVIMAKQVDRRTADKTQASFTINPSPKEP